VESRVFSNKGKYDIKKVNRIVKKEEKSDEDDFSFNYFDRMMRERAGIDESRCKGR
jgi:hypothetical protein